MSRVYLMCRSPAKLSEFARIAAFLAAREAPGEKLPIDSRVDFEITYIEKLKDLIVHEGPANCRPSTSGSFGNQAIRDALLIEVGLSRRLGSDDRPNSWRSRAGMTSCSGNRLQFRRISVSLGVTRRSAAQTAPRIVLTFLVSKQLSRVPLELIAVPPVIDRRRAAIGSRTNETAASNARTSPCHGVMVGRPAPTHARYAEMVPSIDRT